MQPCNNGTKRLNDVRNALFERSQVGELDEWVLQQGSDGRTCRCIVPKALLQEVFELGRRRLPFGVADPSAHPCNDAARSLFLVVLKRTGIILSRYHLAHGREQQGCNQGNRPVTSFPESNLQGRFPALLPTWPGCHRGVHHLNQHTFGAPRIAMHSAAMIPSGYTSSAVVCFSSPHASGGRYPSVPTPVPLNRKVNDLSRSTLHALAVSTCEDRWLRFLQSPRSCTRHRRR